MSSAFSQSLFDRFAASPPAGRENRGRTQRSESLSASVPFLFYPPAVDPAALSLRGPAGLLPYLPPFHHHGHFSVYECPFEPAFIQKRNERERQRVKCVNQGYAKLRDHLPGHSADKRLSKVETLRAAIRYIKYLQTLVDMEDDGREGAEPGGGTNNDPDRAAEMEACWTTDRIQGPRDEM